MGIGNLYICMCVCLCPMIILLNYYIDIYITQIVRCCTVATFQQQATFIRNIIIQCSTNAIQMHHLYRFIGTFLMKAACLYCTTHKDIALYLMCCGVILLSLPTFIHK